MGRAEEDAFLNYRQVTHSAFYLILIFETLYFKLKNIYKLCWFLARTQISHTFRCPLLLTFTLKGMSSCLLRVTCNIPKISLRYLFQKKIYSKHSLSDAFFWREEGREKSTCDRNIDQLPLLFP